MSLAQPLSYSTFTSQLLQSMILDADYIAVRAIRFSSKRRTLRKYQNMVYNEKNALLWHIYIFGLFYS